MTGKTPHEVLNMDPLEREFTLALATELESWRMESYAKMLGAK